eukprot:9918463-Lingulodinium_polyedra.AAC.1
MASHAASTAVWRRLRGAAVMRPSLTNSTYFLKAQCVVVFMAMAPEAKKMACKRSARACLSASSASRRAACLLR